MRNLLSACLFALMIPACLAGELTGVGGTEMEEGGGGGSGSGSGSGSGEIVNTPRIDATVDKTTVMTELGKTENLTVTITSANGFSGPVSVTPSVMNGTTAVTGWTVTPTPATVNLTAGGTATVTLAVAIPTNSEALTPTVKVDLAGSASTSVSTAFNVSNRVTFTIPSGVGTGSHLVALPMNQVLTIRQGTMVVFQNDDGVQHVIHASGGINHENTTSGGMPGAAYMVTPTGDSTWYCHSHEGTGQIRNINVQ